MMKKLHDIGGGMKKSRLLFLMVLLGFVGTFATSSLPFAGKSSTTLPPPDSIITTERVDSQDTAPDEMTGVNNPNSPGYTRLGTYPFLRTGQNFIEWKDENAAQSFFTKLASADKKKLRILHVGDSHLQADIYTGYL